MRREFTLVFLIPVLLYVVTYYALVVRDVSDIRVGPGPWPVSVSYRICVTTMSSFYAPIHQIDRQFRADFWGPFQGMTNRD